MRRDILEKDEKEKQIKSKLTKLNKIFREIPDDRKVVVNDLIQNCAFLAVELEDLQEKIKENGSVEKYTNGANQWGYKVSSASQAYNALAKTYTTNIKVLLGELDNGVSKADTKDKLADFLLKKK